MELHLVSTGAFIEALGCQLPGKEDGDSSSTKTELQSLNSYLMGTSFSKLHPKIQQKTRLAIRTLPPEIQQNILTHKAITSSYDRWMHLFKVLVSTAFIRTEEMTDDTWLSHKATWYESFGEADRVSERTGDRYNLVTLLQILICNLVTLQTVFLFSKLVSKAEVCFQF